MSSGWPIRPTMERDFIRSSSASSSVRVNPEEVSSVSTKPGAMAFTVMPAGASSSAKRLVSNETEALVAP